MAQGLFLVNAVTISAAMFCDTEHAVFLQIAYNFLYGTFGNSNVCSDITQTQLWIPRQANQDMAVITKKCPVIHTTITFQRRLDELYFVFNDSSIKKQDYEAIEH